MKKIILGLSILLNILLLAFCIYQMSRPKVQYIKDDSVEMRRLLQQRFSINNEDVVFMGGKQVADCAWHELLDNCKIKNRGIPGARIKDEFSRLNSILKNSPSQLFLLFGIDDLNVGMSPQSVFEQYKALVQTIRQKSPMTEIIIQSVFPVNNKIPHENINVKPADIEELNQLLKEFALDKGIVFLNLYGDFGNNTGRLVSSYSAGDGFQLSTIGYEMWKERVKTFIR